MKKVLLSIALISSIGFANETKNEINISKLFDSNEIKSTIIQNNSCYPLYTNLVTQDKFKSAKGEDLLAYKLRYDKFPNYNLYSSLQNDFEKNAQDTIVKDKDILCKIESFQNFVNLNKQEFKKANIDVINVTVDSFEMLTNTHKFGQEKAGLFVNNNIKVIKVLKNSKLNDKIKVGDKILEVNGIKIKSSVELEETLNKLNISDKISIKILRGKTTKLIDSTLGVLTFDKNDIVLSSTKDSIVIMPFAGLQKGDNYINNIKTVLNEKPYKNIYIDTSHISLLKLDTLLNLVSELTNKNVYLGIKYASKDLKQSINLGVIGKDDKKLKRNITVSLENNASSAAKLFVYLMKHSDNSVKIDSKNLKQLIETPRNIYFYEDDYIIIKPSKDMYVMPNKKSETQLTDKTIKELLITK